MESKNEITIHYDDDTTRLFLLATIVWGVIGMLVGVVLALQLAFWPANGGIPWLTFGRLRPLHTDAVIFAFAGNAFFAGMYYSMQRLLKTRMWSDTLSAIHFWGWQAIIVAVAITLPLGITQGKEYAEMEWPIDIAIAVVWVLMAVNFFATIAIRRVKHLYVAIWFYIASIITIAMLHVVNGLAIPVGLFKSYSIFSGVQDALVQWWYGHNAVGFLLTTPFLGLLYYFIPKATGNPVYSYRLSIIHFWSLVFIYIWAGPHHLLYTSLPEWVQSLGMVFSVMLIAPSWGGMINGLLTMRGTWSHLRSDPIFKFFVLALTFYGMATFEGSMLSIKAFNMFTHYTDWTIAHVHSGALGWVGGMVFAIAYWMAPKLWGVPLYSRKLANLHFWLATIGILLYVVAMWSGGLAQYLMWMAQNEDGLLKYPQFLETVLAIVPLYWVRLVGGSLYLIGAILCLYNILKTAALGKKVHTKVVFTPEPTHPAKTWHEKLENNGLRFAVLSGLAVLIGGIVEFTPALTVDSFVPKISHVKPYTPLEFAGRDVYLEEGCYNCHSQMVRTLALEEKRYGRHSEGGEFVYDHPFQWGSKRTGPDLHRLGGKYPDLWHYKHMIDPRSTSPGSIMPSYPWLAEDKVDVEWLPRKLKAMQTLGVPYADEIVKSPKETYLKQALAMQKRLLNEGITVSEYSKMVALIAYMQRLGTDIQKAEKGGEK